MHDRGIILLFTGAGDVLSSITMVEPVDTVFLDAGGVLVHPSWTRVSAALARHGVDAPAPALADAEPRATRDLDEASVIVTSDDRKRWGLYFEYVLRQAGVALSDATAAAIADLRDYHHRENLWEDVGAGVIPALQALREHGLRLVVVSNANGRLRYLFDRIDLSRWFDFALDSHEWGVEKPDPRLFRLALEKSGAAAGRTIHVGDLYHVAILLDRADLYAGVDCRRVRSLGEVASTLDAAGG
jgi:HAD superfamily hydrolase (TIGR01509 family)